jgi:Family of unknown function (DUF6629)
VVPVCGCLSAEVDLFAALVIGAVGIDALRYVEHRRQLALAVIPITLAFHQFVEAGAWWSLEGRVPGSVGTVSIYIYLVIALVVVPILIPYAVRSVEPDPRRRRWMTPFLGLGILTGVVLGFTLIVGDVSATIGGNYLDYRIGYTFHEAAGLIYLSAVAAPLLLSSQRLFVGLGVLNLVLVAGIGYLNAAGVISLWCAAAAVQGVAVAYYLRTEAGQPWKIPERLRSLRLPLRTG